MRGPNRAAPSAPAARSAGDARSLQAQRRVPRRRARWLSRPPLGTSIPLPCPGRGSEPLMKLIIQIPCFNEEDQLPLTLGRLPRQVTGFDIVEWLVIDDGSTDETVERARAHGVDHIVRLTNHKGLAAAFQAGLDAGLKLGADVIVNTDADNQYEGSDVPKLVEPIVRGEADMVVGDRQIEKVEHFSGPKKVLQRLGSWVVRQASSTHLPDTTS